jgi:hypothetical protein
LNVPDDDVGVVGSTVYKGDREIVTTGEASHLFNGKWGRAYTFSVSALAAAGHESVLSQTVKVRLSSAWISSL